MKVRNERPNLTRLTRLGFVNAYLVREDDGLTLVDTMLSGSAEGILAAAQELGTPDRAHRPHPRPRRPRRLARRRSRSGCRASRSRSPPARRGCWPATARLDADEPDSKLRGGWPHVATRPTRLLDDGDRVGSLRVVAAPGHTPGHIALRRRARRHADRRRRLLDARRRLDDRPDQPAVPARRHVDVGSRRRPTAPPRRCARSIRPHSPPGTGRSSPTPRPRSTVRSPRSAPPGPPGCA